MYSVQVQGGSRRRRVQHGLMNGFRSEKLCILVGRYALDWRNQCNGHRLLAVPSAEGDPGGRIKQT